MSVDRNVDVLRQVLAAFNAHDLALRRSRGSGSRRGELFVVQSAKYALCRFCGTCRP